MSEFTEWISPLRPGDVVIKELPGKCLVRVRYCPKEAEIETFPGEGHFFEFQFTDGSIFRLDSRTGFKAQFMDVDEEGDLAGDIVDYGFLGDS